ncbi:MAG: hypothetical protein PUA74_04725, partial [Clostridiales bacterium]|nr:hypothetical protein [Clostridiales bacterium]
CQFRHSRMPPVFGQRRYYTAKECVCQPLKSIFFWKTEKSENTSRTDSYPPVRRKRGAAAG